MSRWTMGWYTKADVSNTPVNLEKFCFSPKKCLDDRIYFFLTFKYLCRCEMKRQVKKKKLNARPGNLWNKHKWE